MLPSFVRRYLRITAGYYHPLLKIHHPTNKLRSCQVSVTHCCIPNCFVEVDIKFFVKIASFTSLHSSQFRPLQQMSEGEVQVCSPSGRGVSLISESRRDIWVSGIPVKSGGALMVRHLPSLRLQKPQAKITYKKYTDLLGRRLVFLEPRSSSSNRHYTYFVLLSPTSARYIWQQSCTKRIEPKRDAQKRFVDLQAYR